jgi:hypothetical protein
MAEEVRFCPLLTVVRAGQANYMVCQSNCNFFIEDECAFITASKALKELVKNDTINQGRKDKSEK